MDFIFINLITAKAIRTPPQIIERILYNVSFSIFKLLILNYLLLLCLGILITIILIN